MLLSTPRCCLRNVRPHSSRKTAQDLLAGISMSQLFSQPSTTPRAAHSRLSDNRTTSKVNTYSPGKPPPASPTGQGGATRNNSMPKWWERQTTTELEIAGIVDDVINTRLLSTGSADAEAGRGKPMAVASLRELWDEEKERSRVAGGGSQLSAPPGLELADSQDVWEPPEGLLTQHMRGEVEDLAHNVLQRMTTPSQEEPGVLSQQQEPSQPSSQASTGGDGLHERVGEVGLTPSREGMMSQSSVPDASAVPDASSPPASYLPSLGGVDDDDDVDQGLLDLITALRGSQQSQGNGDELHLPSPAGQRYTQSPPGPLSQPPVFTPESSADQAEAVAATQVRR